MKSKILGLTLLAGAVILTSCVDTEQNSNDSVLQNALIVQDSSLAVRVVGINQASIPEFENDSGANPTDVTVTFSNKPAGCTLVDVANNTLTDGVLTDTSVSNDISSISSLDFD